MTIKNEILAFLGLSGSFFAYMLGGWDYSLQTLIIFMGADFLTGFLLALLWGKSSKSTTGCANSKVCWKGLIRKGGILLVVLIAARLDIMLGTKSFARNAVILFFIGNEGLSLIENLAVMGVPMPNWLKDKLEIIKNQGSNEKQEK